MKKIRIEIKNGVVTVDKQGFTGKDCEKASKFIDEELGELQTKTKPEYAKSVTHAQTAKAQA